MASQPADLLVSRLRVLRSSADQFLRGLSITNPNDRALLDELASHLTGTPYRTGSPMHDALLDEEAQRETIQFTSVSNVLKTRHDAAKNAINNVR